MDPRLLRYYERELKHLREMGGEFAEDFPKIAGRLGLDAFECADPYVERLLEGFGFLAARVQLKLDSEFSRFTQHLLEMVYPHYLAPTPSMAVVQFEPDPAEGALTEGFELPRQTELRSLLGKGEQTPCEYRTAHDVKLYPIRIAEASYFVSLRDVGLDDRTMPPGVKGGIRLKLETTSGLPFDKISLDSLVVFVRGVGETSMAIVQQVFSNTLAVVVQPGKAGEGVVRVDPSCLKPVGFRDREALLPYGDRSFHGYRLLHEYFAFPDRYMFVEIGGLGEAVAAAHGPSLEIDFLFDRVEPVLEGAVDTSQFALHCSPVVNIVSKRADRIHMSEGEHEYHIVPDRTRPMDFEIYQVEQVVGHGTSADMEQEFLPFYAFNDLTRYRKHDAYFTVRRVPRVLSSKQRRYGPRSSYVGNEVYVSLVDSREAPFSSDLRQLAVTALCTNRDLPIQMPVGQGSTDFTLQTAAPVLSTRCLAGPTRPRPSHAEGETSWRLVSQLALNYLSLMDTDERQGAAGLRELLMLYGADRDPEMQRQIEGVYSVDARPVVRRVDLSGPLAFVRGLEVGVTFDEGSYGGTGYFVLGAVLERFFAKYVSINSFTETVIHTRDRGEVMRWPIRAGRRHLI